MTNGSVAGRMLAAAALFAGCAAVAANPRLSLRYDKDWRTIDAAAAIAQAPPGDVAIQDLGRTAWVSHHIAVVRTAEQPHYHRFHDLTVMVLCGEGVLNVEQRHIPMKAGDVAHVNRGVPHFFRNTGKEPAAAFVVFAPPFDGRDTITAETKEEEAPPQAPPAKKRWWWPF